MSRTTLLLLYAPAVLMSGCAYLPLGPSDGDRPLETVCSSWIESGVDRAALADPDFQALYWTAAMSSNAYWTDRDSLRRAGHWIDLAPHYALVHRARGPGGFAADVYEGRGHLVIAFRGSDDLSDWFYNTNVPVLPLPFLKPHDQDRHALDLYRSVADTTGREVVVTGHSLGGGLAVIVGMVHRSTRAHAYNLSTRLGMLDPRTLKGDTENVTVVFEAEEILDLVVDGVEMQIEGEGDSVGASVYELRVQEDGDAVAKHRMLPIAVYALAVAAASGDPEAKGVLGGYVRSRYSDLAGAPDVGVPNVCLDLFSRDHYVL